jgi:hypothetical protein
MNTGSIGEQMMILHERRGHRLESDSSGVLELKYAED